MNDNINYTHKGLTQDDELWNNIKKKSPVTRQRIILFSLIVGLILGLNRYGHIIFTQVHVAQYMDEVYPEYREVNVTMNEVINAISERKRIITASEIQSSQENLTRASTIFDEAKVPKNFEAFHTAAKESFLISQQLYQALEAHNSSISSQTKMINILITKQNRNITSTRNLLETSFERTKIQVPILEVEQFQFWYVSDKSFGKPTFK